MSHVFNAKSGLVLVEAEVSGPTGKAGATLVLDTGATTTALNANVLRAVGYDPNAANEFVNLTTDNATLRVPRLTINRLGALGRHAIGLKVLAHDLSVQAAVDGLLGLDFFRGLTLTLDFNAGRITLT